MATGHFPYVSQDCGIVFPWTFVNGTVFLLKKKKKKKKQLKTYLFRKFIDNGLYLLISIFILLIYRQEHFSEKQTTRKFHTKLHPELEWRIFHILTSVDIEDVISRFYTAVCAKILFSI